MSGVLKMSNIVSGNDNTIEWAKVGWKQVKGEFVEYPLKVWQNLETVLDKHNIKLSLNLINHDIDYIGLNSTGSRNGKLTDIHSLQIEEGLNLNKDDTLAAVKRIAEKNCYNPFVDMLIENENYDYEIVRKLFNCLEINDNNPENIEFYFRLFVKWCLNVVKMAQNDLEKDLGGQGVLVLQGGQGCFKSTFCRYLMPDNRWFKGDKSLEPDKTDSVIQNTSYILVEWGELDSTLKGEQAKLKQFITATNDEYRTPYDKVSEKYPRLTSYIGTVNKKDFLKDETGSRRFWIIPIKKCDINKLKEIDMKQFWGAVYSIFKDGRVIDYLNDKDLEKIKELNSDYNFVSDISITLDEKLDWDSPIEEWDIYNTSEICNYLLIKEKKSLSNELLRRGIEYKSYRLRTGKIKKGYKIPKIELSYSF